jgi:TolB protein
MTSRLPIFAVAVLATLAGAGAALLEGIRGVDASGRSVAEIAAGRPALVLLTSPRVASVGAQLRLLRFLHGEVGEEAAVAAVIYGEKETTLAKFREGMPFPVVAGVGEATAAVLGKGGKLPTVLVVTRTGNVADRYPEVPDPLAAAEALKLRYEPGPPGPPAAGDLVPELIVSTSAGEAFNLRAAALNNPATLIFAFDVDDADRRRYLASLQRLADDLGERAQVLAVALGASTAAAAKLAEAEYLDLPLLVGSPLARRRLVGDLAPPVLIVTEAKGIVRGTKERATVPAREDVAGEELGPAEEGPAVELVVKQREALTAGLYADLPPVAAFDAMGRYVLFHGRFAEAGVDHLWEIAATGKNLRQISHAAAPDVAPSCSADGVHVAFLSGRSGENEIWICERLHGEFTQITKSGGTFGPPAYAADGKAIAAPRRVSPGGEANYDVWTMDARGRRLRPVAETFYNEIEPAWAPDGQTLLFASDRYDNWDILSSDLSGGKRRRLTGPETEDRTPTVSPDGRYVVYARREGDGPYKLWAMNADGSSKTPLTAGAGNDLYPRFNRQGYALVFASDRSGAYEVYKLTFEAEIDYDLPRPGRPLSRLASR